MLILAAAIAFVTLRADSQTASAIDPVETSVAEPRGTSQDDVSTAAGQPSGDATEADPAAAASEEASSEAASSEQASSASPQPASIPRVVVSAPEIVGIVNGRITFVADGAPAPDVLVVLIASDETGTIGDTLQELATDADGRYGFDVDDGCYIAEFTAPEGHAFPGVGAVLTGPPVCVSADSPFTLGASLEVAG